MLPQNNHPEYAEGTLLTDYSNIALTVHHARSGGMGRVYLGPDALRDGRWIALKTIRPDLLHRPALRERFLSEALLWVGVWPHPNLLLAQTVTEINGQLFLWLDYAEHGSLGDLLDRVGGPLPFELAFLLAQQITAGLVALHTPDPAHLRPFPLLHRDLKPQNILINAQGYALITDFGLAKVLLAAAESDALPTLLAPDDEEDATEGTQAFRTQAGIGMGTAPYMPPEQWRDAAQVTTAADIYALGVILGQMFLGQHPVVRLPGQTWEAAHREGERRRLPGVVPAYLHDTFAAMLAPDPAQRPDAATVLAVLQRAARFLRQEVYQPSDVYPHTPEHERIFWQSWASAYFRFERYEEAWERNERAYALDPTAFAVLMTRGNLLWNGQRDEVGAQAMYAAALDALPPDDRARRSGVWNQRGVLARQMGDYAGAEAAYAEALALLPDAADTWGNRAVNQRAWAQALLTEDKASEARTHVELGLEYGRTALGLNRNHENNQRIYAALLALEAELRRQGH